MQINNLPFWPDGLIVKDTNLMDFPPTFKAFHKSVDKIKHELLWR